MFKIITKIIFLLMTLLAFSFPSKPFNIPKISKAISNEDKSAILNYDYEETLPTYMQDVTTKINEPSTFKIKPFSYDMNEYDGETKIKFTLPFSTTKGDHSIGYFAKAININNEEKLLARDVATIYASKDNQSFKITFSVDFDYIGELAKFSFLLYDFLDKAKEEVRFDFYLTAPNEIRTNNQYVRIFSKVYLDSSSVLHNIEDRIEILNIPKVVYRDVYLMFYSDSMYLRCQTSNDYLFNSYLLFNDKYGFLIDPFKKYSDYDNYYGAALQVYENTPSKGLIKLSYQKAFYVDLVSYMMKKNKKELTYYYAVRDLFFPVSKYELYKEIDMKLVLEGIGRSNTTLVYDFKVVFNDKNIQETLQISRENVIGEYSPNMKEVVLWTLESYIFR